MKNIVLTYKGCSITVSTGDRIIYDKKWGNSDRKAAPFWGGQYGKIEGTILSHNSEIYINRYGTSDNDSFPLKVLWDNGEINGFNLVWIPHFTIKYKQLKLFGD